MNTEEQEIETTTENLEQENLEQDGGTEAGDHQPDADTSTTQESEESGPEVVVSIGEPDPQAEEERKAPQWVRDLRRSDREKTRKIKELEAKLNANIAETKPVQLGAKPKIEDFDYDAEKFEAALTNYFETKRRVDEEEQKKRDAAKTQEESWQAELQKHEKAKAEFKTKVEDFDESEEVATSILDGTQLGLVIHLCENSAVVLHALGTNPKEAKRLAEIKDYPKFVKELTLLEATKMKVTPRKSKPEPERVVNGTGRVSGSVDSTLERLREEAARTGDSSKVVAYKRQKQNAKT